MNRTYDLKVMSLASYHCSTPRYTNGMMSHYCELDCSTPRYMVFFWRRVIIWNSGICQYVFSQCGSDYVYEVLRIEYERGLIAYPSRIFFILFVHWVSGASLDTRKTHRWGRGADHSAHSAIRRYPDTYPTKMEPTPGSYVPNSPLSGWWRTHSYQGYYRTHELGGNRDRLYLVAPLIRGDYGGFAHFLQNPIHRP